MNPKTRPFPTTLALSLLCAACATSTSPADTAALSPNAASGTATEDPKALEAAQLDDTPPIPLDQWRKINEEGKAAVRTTALEERIEKCKAFVSTHGNHQGSGEVLEALADAMLEGGDYEARELAKYIEQRCHSEEDASGLPVELVRSYHIKHKLPLESSVRLLDEARKRIEKDWEEDVENETDESTKKRQALYLSYKKIQTHVLEGRVYLQHNEPKKALDALERAKTEAKNFPYDIVMVGDDGKEHGTLGSGLLDDMHVLTAAALDKLGQKAEAKKAFTRAVGFVNDVEMRELYAQTRQSLGLASKSEREIGAQPLPAQDFALEDLTGKSVKLSDYRGKVVLVTFWATWCGPCKKEMPELQKFLKANRDKGVEVLAVNIDSYTERAKVKPFLEKHDLDVKVLFEQPEQLSEYNYNAIPALYVIDREGRIAHARTGYDPDLETKLENEITDLVTGKHGDSSRSLFAIETAPAGFDVRWKRPVTGDAAAVAIAAPIGKAAGEVAVLGRKGLMRWTATGDEQTAQPVAGFTRSVRAADLDGDGKREWVLGGWQSLKVMDSQGKLYWDYKTQRMAEVSDVADLDGDGYKEIIVQDENRVLAMKAIPEPRWSTKSIEELESVTVDNGRVVVQADGVLATYGGDGKIQSQGTKAPEGRHHRASLDAGGKGRLRLFGGLWDAQPDTSHDIDGDGRNDVVLTNESGLVAYDADGKPILRIRGKDASLQAAVGDLDGKPGAEVLIFVDHYGVVVLGKKN